MSCPGGQVVRRAPSRSSRFARLRTTAAPTFFDATTASRLASCRSAPASPGSPAARGLSCSRRWTVSNRPRACQPVRKARVTLRPCRNRRTGIERAGSSGSFVITAPTGSMRGTVARRTPRAVTQTTSTCRDDAGHRRCAFQRACASGDGSRACARGGGSWAGTYASQQALFGVNLRVVGASASESRCNREPHGSHGPDGAMDGLPAHRTEPIAFPTIFAGRASTGARSSIRLGSREQIPWSSALRAIVRWCKATQAAGRLSPPCTSQQLEQPTAHLGGSTTVPPMSTVCEIRVGRPTATRPRTGSPVDANNSIGTSCRPSAGAAMVPVVRRRLSRADRGASHLTVPVDHDEHRIGSPCVLGPTGLPRTTRVARVT